MVPETPLVTLTSVRATNTLRRDVESSVTRSNIDATGDVNVMAVGDPRLIATTDSVALRVKESGNVTSNAKGVAATLAVNVLLGGVDAHVVDSTVSADNLTIAATTDQALVDATAQASAFAKDSADTVTIPGPTGGNALTIGASLALNFIGWDVTNVTLSAVDAFLGTDFGADEEPYLVRAYADNTKLTATGDIDVAASSAPLINATVTNSAESENHGLFGVKSTAAGAILASNKISSQAVAYISYEGDHSINETGATLAPGATVQLATGLVYRYLGTAATGVNLGSETYSNGLRWELISNVTAGGSSPSAPSTTPGSTRTRSSSRRRSRRTTAARTS